MQKTFSAFVILAAASVGWIDALASADVPHGKHVHASDVAPEPLPLDLSDAPSLRAPNKPAGPLTGPAIETQTRVLVCGEPEPLLTDPVQTVGRCEWK